MSVQKKKINGKSVSESHQQLATKQSTLGWAVHFHQANMQRGKKSVPPGPLLVLAGKGHINHTHQVFARDCAINSFVNLHELLVFPCRPHWDDEATTWLQLLHQL